MGPLADVLDLDILNCGLESSAGWDAECDDDGAKMCTVPKGGWFGTIHGAISNEPPMKFSFSKIGFALALAGLIVGIWYFFHFLPTRAEAKWRQAESDYLARGEMLSVSDFLPPLVVDERNFFADPLWDELTDREVTTTGGILHSKTRTPQEKLRLHVLRRSFANVEKETLEGQFPEYGPLDGQKGHLEILRAVWEKAEESGDTARAAEFVLAGLAPSEPVISRLRELAERPDALFPNEYEDGMLMSLEHVSYLLAASRWLELGASVSLSRGKFREAFEDVLLIFRLAETLKRELVLISILAETHLVRIGIDLVHRGIEVEAWTDSELEQFERLLVSLNIPQRLAFGLRFERAVMLDVTLPAGEKLGSRFWALASSGVRSSIHLPSSPVLSWVYFRYWMPGDKILYSQLVQQMAEVLDRASVDGVNPAFFTTLIQETFGGAPSEQDQLRNAMTLANFSFFQDFVPSVLQVQSLVHQARIGIAQERYRLKKGRHPGELNDLVPEFLDALPTDPLTVQPFLSRKKDSGKFITWSAGWNKTDEGGQSDKTPTKGDWVWGHSLRN
jgi:hypothetical protein